MEPATRPRRAARPSSPAGVCCRIVDTRYGWRGWPRTRRRCAEWEASAVDRATESLKLLLGERPGRRLLASVGGGAPDGRDGH